MPIWYKGFEAVGTTPPALVKKVADLVKNFDLGGFMPVMRVEKRGSGRFCFFLAIESSTIGEIPQEIQNILFHVPMFKRPIDGAFDYEQIRPMVGAQHDIHDYARLIPYWRPPPDENPFDLMPLARNHRVDNDTVKTRTQRHDHLLLWLSAMGMGSWDVFCGACQTLGLDGDRTTPQRILRRLRLLGHIETSPDGRRWAIAPPVLVRIDEQRDEVHYILCGARDALLLNALRRNADIVVSPQIDGSAPATVGVRTDDAEALETMLSSAANRLRIADNAAYRLAQILPTITDWMDMLQMLQGIEPSMFDIKRYVDRAFVDDVFDKDQSGFYELWPLEARQSATARPKYILFYDAAKRRWLRGDWYGLRFLALQSSGAPCPIRYDLISRRLAIFEDWRWPELYERVLVLASGRLPSYNQRYLIYDSISPQLLTELSAKLDQQYQEI